MEKIYLADDNKTNRYVLEKALAAAGYNVRTFKDGRELLDEFLKEPPDIIITDVKMPVMDGYELIKAVRADNTYDHIPIVCISAAYTDLASKIQGFNEGANDYMTTPINEDELTAKIKSLLKVKDLIVSLRKSETRLQNEKDRLNLLLSTFNNRENRMVELKKEINALLEEAGKPPKYMQ